MPCFVGGDHEEQLGDERHVNSECNLKKIHAALFTRFAAPLAVCSCKKNDRSLSGLFDFIFAFNNNHKRSAACCILLSKLLAKIVATAAAHLDKEIIAHGPFFSATPRFANSMSQIIYRQKYKFIIGKAQNELTNAKFGPTTFVPEHKKAACIRARAKSARI